MLGIKFIRENRPLVSYASPVGEPDTARSATTKVG